MIRPQFLFPLFGTLENLKGIGSKSIFNLKKLAILKPLDFLYSFPSNLKIRKFTNTINDFFENEIIILKVKIINHHLQYFKGPLNIEVTDGFNNINLIFFNAKKDWIKKNFPINHERFISGKLEKYKNKYQIIHPDYIETIDNLAQIPEIEPIYSLTKGISQKIFQNSIKQILKFLPKEISYFEWIDEKRLKKMNWSNFNDSLKRIHNPKTINDISLNSNYRLRLAYDELLSHQLSLVIARSFSKKINKRRKKISQKLCNLIKQKLPFSLTISQEKCIAEIKSDLLKNERMYRLIQGDVGSGKTLVAFFSILFIAENGGQSALMVPTDILAKQHYSNFQKYTQDLGINTVLLTGKMKANEKNKALQTIKSGEADIIVGTHSLFQKGVIFDKLELVIIDEQHKFGVRQRHDLIQKGENLDILVMTATPIPRTLELANYGDMDISRITEKPLNRKKIKTSIISEKKIEVLIPRLIEICNKGVQCYWVCPLIEEGDKSELVAIEQRFSSLKTFLPNINIEILHGKMTEEEKNEIMTSFKDGNIQILLATTVIEVGIDVPNATVIVIECAERFGLAQLHQLRGRVGRGELNSNCILIYSKNVSKFGKERLEVLRKFDNGFDIAEEDLKMRGGGNPIGSQQSGIPKFQIANLDIDKDLLFYAHEDANQIIKDNKYLIGKKGKNFRILLHLMNKDKSLSLLKAG
ncbi:MAG: ATP-dependent DNA helicase RecG [Paracoccaceae bacterium]